ncbi:secretion/DNA translocation related TadE-like protein [Agrococcus sp. UYP10]|uniref:Rv3654c family TadE-like protein n=1 Tax=Agrococcus sp. UYP10 TaxID=1756355 RepID=UPI0033999EC6
MTRARRGAARALDHRVDGVAGALDGTAQRRPDLRGDGGAGAALALAMATAAVLLALLVVGAGTASIAQARAAAAADAAALAAADALSGYADGSPCGLAQAVAAASGARLGACVVDGLEARVTTTVPIGPLTASGAAIAGPPAVGAP